MKTYDAASYPSDIGLESLKVINWAPVLMTRTERLMLFTLIVGLRPLRYLEIGTYRGGSALIVCGAMDEVRSEGVMVCVDPEPQIAAEDWERIHHRAILVKGHSPSALRLAVERAGGNFDFVLIDGDHSEEGVLRDAAGVIPFVTDGGYLLFHDSFNPDVAQGIDRFAGRYADVLEDFGVLTREYTLLMAERDTQVKWGGLRMIRVQKKTLQ
jgi:predicted O-methyltransferase YrrM